MSDKENWLTKQIQLAECDEYCLDFHCGLHGQGREFFERIVWECARRVGLTLPPFERHCQGPVLADIPGDDQCLIAREVIRELRRLEFVGVSEYQRQAMRVVILHLHKSHIDLVCGQTIEEAIAGSPSEIALRAMQMHNAQSQMRRSFSETDRNDQIAKKQNKKQEKAVAHLEREAKKRARNEQRQTELELPLDPIGDQNH
jgi:hypothetical protein